MGERKQINVLPKMSNFSFKKMSRSITQTYKNGTTTGIRSVPRGVQSQSNPGTLLGLFFLPQRSEGCKLPASQRGGLKPPWHRRGRRSHQSCEVYGLKSGYQSAVTDSVGLSALLGQSASEHRATSKSSTLCLLNLSE